MPSTSNPIRGRIIASGLISLLFVSAVVAFEVLLAKVDCVVLDRTVTLLNEWESNQYF